jgi:hypothetical protein
VSIPASAAPTDNRLSMSSSLASEQKAPQRTPPQPAAAPPQAAGPAGAMRTLQQSAGNAAVARLVEDAQQPAADKRYSLEFVIGHNRERYPDLTEEQAIAVLWKVWKQLHEQLDFYRGWHQTQLELRNEHWIVGYWSDTFGGVEMPDIDMWNAVGRGPLWEAAHTLQQGEGELQRELAARAEVRRRLAGTFAGQFLEPAAHSRVERAAQQLQAGADRLRECQETFFAYKDGTEKGAGRAITGMKVTIVVLSAAATGGAAGFAGPGAGLFAQSGASALAAGGLGAFTESATQVGQMRIGEREWGDFDFKRIGKVGVTDMITGFVGGVVGGKFAGALKGAFGRLVSGMGKAELAAYGLTADELLTSGEKLFADWAGGVGATPVTTAVGALVNRGFEGTWSAKSPGEFLDQMLDDMKTSGILGGFLTFGGHAMGGHGGGAPAEGEAPATSPGTKPAEAAKPAAAQAKAAAEATAKQIAPAPAAQAEGAAPPEAPKPLEAAKPAEAQTKAEAEATAKQAAPAPAAHDTWAKAAAELPPDEYAEFQAELSEHLAAEAPAEGPRKGQKLGAAKAGEKPADPRSPAERQKIDEILDRWRKEGPPPEEKAFLEKALVRRRIQARMKLRELNAPEDLQRLVREHDVEIGKGTKRTLSDLAYEDPRFTVEAYEQWKARAAKPDKAELTFEEYLAKHNALTRGREGEARQAFKRGQKETMIVAPGETSEKGIDYVPYDPEVDIAYLDDNKAIATGQQHKVSALEENLPQNLREVVKVVKGYADKPGTPAEIKGKVLPRLEAASKDIDAMYAEAAKNGVDVKGETFQEQVTAKLAEYRIQRRVNFEAAGPGTGPGEKLVQRGTVEGEKAPPKPPKPPKAPKPPKVKVSKAPEPKQAKPAEAKPAEAKPPEAKPAEAKPPEAKPPEAKPAEAKPPQAAPPEAKPPEPKPVAKTVPVYGEGNPPPEPKPAPKTVPVYGEGNPPPEPKSAPKPPPPPPGPAESFDRYAQEREGAAKEERGGYEGAGLILHEKIMGTIQQQERDKAAAAVAKLQPRIDKATSEGKFVVVVTVFDEPEIPDFFGQMAGYTEEREIKRFQYAYLRTGWSPDGARNDELAPTRSEIRAVDPDAPRPVEDLPRKKEGRRWVEAEWALVRPAPGTGRYAPRPQMEPTKAVSGYWKRANDPLEMTMIVVASGGGIHVESWSRAGTWRVQSVALDADAFTLRVKYWDGPWQFESTFRWLGPGTMLEDCVGHYQGETATGKHLWMNSDQLRMTIADPLAP